MIDDIVRAWADFHFLRPLWLLALPPLWALVFWLARRRQRDGDWSALIDAELLPALRLAGDSGAAGIGRRDSAAALPWPWLLLAWTLATLALAGPSASRDATPAYRAAQAWVLVLDLSPSMAAADLAPDRATRARYAIEDLLAASHDARVGLVAFGDEAYTVVPLTDDVDTVRALLPPLVPTILPGAGDHLAPALARAQQLLARAGVRRGHVIVLSDGFGDPAASLQAAGALHADSATVDVVGIASAGGAPVPLAGGGFVADAQGKPQLARLDAELLQRLAATGGGRYVELSALPSLIDTLNATPLPGSGRETTAAARLAHWRDAGAWLVPALLLVVAGLTRRGWL